MAGEWKLRLDDERRARWDAAAEKAGSSSLAEFVTEAVEARIEGRMLEGGRAVVPLHGAKEFRGMDPKVKERPRK